MRNDTSTTSFGSFTQRQRRQRNSRCIGGDSTVPQQRQRRRQSHHHQHQQHQQKQQQQPISCRTQLSLIFCTCLLMLFPTKIHAFTVRPTKPNHFTLSLLGNNHHQQQQEGPKVFCKDWDGSIKCWEFSSMFKSNSLLLPASSPSLTAKSLSLIQTSRAKTTTTTTALFVSGDTIDNEVIHANLSSLSPPLSTFSAANETSTAVTTTAVVNNVSNSSINGGNIVTSPHHNNNNVMINGASNQTDSVTTATAIFNGIPEDIVKSIAAAPRDAFPDVPRPTANGGFSHTTQSRAKISAANKGKVPWNKGRNRSDEVKARISAGVRAKNRERFLQKLNDMGVTEEEYEAKKKEEKRVREAERRARRTEKGGFRPTNETKQKISKILKEKFAKGELKRGKIPIEKVRRGFTHTEETRAKISASLKARYARDPTYREKVKKKAVESASKEEISRRISETLKRRWKDPEFRARMLKSIDTRKKTYNKLDSDYRKKISETMKRNWQNKDFREKRMKEHAARRARLAALRPPKEPKPKKKSPVPKKPKGSSSLMIQPLTQEDLDKKRERAEMIKLKRKQKRAEQQALKREEKQQVENNSVKKKKVVVKKRKKSKKVVKTKEPDGSVNRLREERRDLFDLLYGDEEGKVLLPNKLGLHDDNLDTFDPYGLADY